MNALDFLTFLGCFVAVIGAIAVLVGAYCLVGELQFRIQWVWGNAHQMSRSVKMGWNTGEPPVGKLILVRNHIDQFDGKVPEKWETNWSVMIRRGNRCFSLSGGFSTPIENITGWLEIVEDKK